MATFSLVASAWKSTSTWSQRSLSAASTASISAKAWRPERRKTLPCRLTTPSRTPSRSTTHEPWPGWEARKFAGRRIRS
jgi:hypothetical protein